MLNHPQICTYMEGQASGDRKGGGGGEREEEAVHRALQQQKASVSSGVITEAGQNFN